MTMEKFDEGEQEEEEGGGGGGRGGGGGGTGGAKYFGWREKLLGKKNGVTSCMGHRCLVSFETVLGCAAF